MTHRTRDWTRFTEIDFEAAAARLEGVIEHTPLAPLDSGDPRIELRAKLENRQINGAFKSRGAWNNVSQLTDEERKRGVVACSSGNHGRALAWAAERAGVPATIVMPKDAYANKIQACRDAGATVVLSEDRVAAEVDSEALAAKGLVSIHPYAKLGTLEGAGTVGLEIAEQWPEVEVVIVPVGGGGLIGGSSLALRRALGEKLIILGVEPAGAPSMKLGLEAGKPVFLEEIETKVQGLCPSDSGALAITICLETVDEVLTLEDDVIFEAQKRLVQGGEVVEPAGAASAAVVFSGALPEHLLAGRDAQNPLRVAVVISGGNPDPAQLAELRGEA